MASGLGLQVLGISCFFSLGFKVQGFRDSGPKP